MALNSGFTSGGGTTSDQYDDGLDSGDSDSSYSISLPDNLTSGSSDSDSSSGGSSSSTRTSHSGGSSRRSGFTRGSGSTGGSGSSDDTETTPDVEGTGLTESGDSSSNSPPDADDVEGQISPGGGNDDSRGTGGSSGGSNDNGGSSTRPVSDGSRVGFDSGTGEIVGSNPSSDSAGQARDALQQDVTQAEELLTRRDQGSRGPVDPERARKESHEARARQIAEENVDTTLQEGLEGPAGESYEVDGRNVSVREQAKRIEKRAIEQNEWADSRRDVAVRIEDGQWVAQPSRSGAIGYAADRIARDLQRWTHPTSMADLHPRQEQLLRGTGHTRQTQPTRAERPGRKGLTGRSGPSGSVAESRGPQEPRTDDPEGGDEGFVDLAYDIVFQEHEGDSVSSTDLYRASGANAVVDTVFQRPEEIERHLGIPAEQRDDSVALSGPSFNPSGFWGEGKVLRSGRRGDLDKDVLGTLSEGRGWLTPEQRADLQQDIEQRREYFGVSEGAEEFVTDTTGNQKAGRFAGGIGNLPGEAAALPATATLASDTALRGAQNLPETVDEYGAGAVTYNLLEAGGRAVEGVIREAKQNPYGFAGEMTGALVGGAAAGRLVQKAPSYYRSGKVRARGGRVYHHDDLADPPTRTEPPLELPGYTQRAQADPEVAKAEFIEQAKQGPLAQNRRRIDTSLKADQDSPPVSVDPELADAVRRAPTRAKASVAGGARRVRDLPENTVARIDDAAYRAGVRTGERITGAEEYLRGPPGRLDDAAYQAGVRVGETSRAVQEFPSTVKTRGVQRLQAFDDAVYRAGQKTGAGLNAFEDAAVRARESLGGGAGPAMSVRPSNVLGGFGGGLRTLDYFGYNAGVRTGGMISRVEDMAGRAAGYRPQPLGAMDYAAFEAGRRTGSLVSRIEDTDPRDFRDLTVEVGLTKGEPSPVAYHVRSAEAVDEYGGFGRRYEAPEGSSELPGLFQSADLSNLRLSQIGGSGLSMPTIGLPRPQIGGSRVLAERGVDVDITEGRSRQEVSRYLEEDASRSKSYVRTDTEDGGPTPEQEVVAPPGSQFVDDGGVFGVRVGGRRIPFTDWRLGGEVVTGRAVRRADVDDMVASDVHDTMSGYQVASETTEAIEESYYRQASNQVPFLPVGGFGVTETAGQSQGLASSVNEDLDRLYGGRRVTEATTRPESAADGEYVDPDYTAGDKDLPWDWKRVDRDELERRNREVEYDRRSRDSQYRDYADRDGYTTQPESGRVTDQDRRVTSGESETRSQASGPSSGGTTGGSSGPMGYSEPEYPPMDRPQPIRYPVRPPTTPTEVVETPPPSNPYTPTTPTTPYIPEITGQRLDWESEDEVDKQQAMMGLGAWGKGWVNPVADAQQATQAVLGGLGGYGGGGGFDPLGAVRQDLERLR